MAAMRSGVKTVIVPRENEKDLLELPKEVKEKMEFRMVIEIGEVLDEVIIDE